MNNNNDVRKLAAEKKRKQDLCSCIKKKRAVTKITSQAFRENISYTMKL